jgi:UPF0716 protein FxsA
VGSGRPRRVRRFLPLLVAAWVILEIWLLVEVAHLIGWFPLILLLIASVVLGSWVIKRAGLRALRAATSGKAEAQTAVSIAGGLLLILPGLLSDLLGLACLFPPTAGLLRKASSRLLTRTGGPLSDAYRMQEQMRIHRPDGKVVVGEVVDPEQPYDYGRRDQIK